eukprot:10443492-Alexandrium_andersonii.AAC.1
MRAWRGRTGARTSTWWRARSAAEAWSSGGPGGGAPAMAVGPAAVSERGRAVGQGGGSAIVAGSAEVDVGHGDDG